jgi:hypothetical protein
LIVGTGTSGIDISHDLSPHVSKIYIVGKNTLRGPEGYKSMRRFQRYILPKNAEQLPEISGFDVPIPGQDIKEARVILCDGRVVTGIDRIIFATGYVQLLPSFVCY